MKEPKNQFQNQFEPTKSPRRRGGLAAALLPILLVVIAALAFLNRQWIIDQVTFWQFQPSAEIAAIASKDKLTDLGKFYLYASQAEVNDRDAFNEACGGLQTEKTIVLGCYAGPLRRIYIFGVSDTRLDGVKEVTSAHEMLHAAYDRLSDSEKQRIDSLLIEQQKTITDQRILNTIEEYKKTEPTEIVNEMHSIFGTEVRNISPELEDYYKRYFVSRSDIIGYAEKYEKVFTDIKDQQTNLVQELNSLARDVNARQAQYQSSLATLNTDIAQFNLWAQSGSATRSEYSTRRLELDKRIAALDSERNAVNDQIDSYNKKKVALEALNVQAESLNQSINSKLETAPSL